MSILTPDYLNLDFDTILANLRTQLQANDTFRDVNYEGSNITVLMELVSFLGDLQTFLANKIAKNVFTDTSDIYETTHRQSELQGYSPKGYVPSRTPLTVTVSGGISIGDSLSIPAWHEIDTDQTNDDGETITFSTVTPYVETVTAVPHTFTIRAKQGTVTTYSDYTGDDIVDNRLTLPKKQFAYDDDLSDALPTVQLSVDGEIWDRIDDFYDEISGLFGVTDEVYVLKYDKYEFYKLVFSSSRSVPGTSDTFEIKILETFGADGDVAAGTTWTPTAGLITNSTTGVTLTNSMFTISNSAASWGGADPEEISTIKENAKTQLHAQFRNVTNTDYKSYLQSRTDVVKANTWGEQEIAPSGNVLEYNKVHISVIPTTWAVSTIDTSASTLVNGSLSASIDVPTAYSTVWKSTLSTYLEPRKIQTAYEYYELPQLTYFWLDISMRIKRTYTYANVLNDVRNKLIYYFSNANRYFHETINWMDVVNYVVDTNETSSSDSFTYVRGIENFVIRDIDSNRVIYEPNSSNNYPQYTVDAATWTGDNRLRKITLGFNQFPQLAIDLCSFTQET